MTTAAPYASLNGERIISGRITIPLYGIWSADVVLANPNIIPTAVTIVVGDLSLSGTVFRMSAYGGARSARVVGGALGWRKTIPAQFYQNPSGVPLSMVMRDAASAVGETVNVVTDQTLGAFYTREQAPAQRLLQQLCGPLWWMDPKSGITQIGATRSSSLITSSWQLIAWNGGKGEFEIATEINGDWLPGRTFTNPVILPVIEQISMTTIALDADGSARTTILVNP